MMGLVLLFVFPVRAEGGVFRGFVWGVSEADVMKFETATFYKKEGESLTFLEEPDAFRRLITYDFRDGRLWRGRYEYADLHDPNPQKIIDIYDKERRTLEKKLGMPATENLTWKDKTYRDHPQFWGRALMAGNLTFSARWQTQDTDIELQTYDGQDFYQVFYTMQKRDAQTYPDPADILNLPQKVR